MANKNNDKAIIVDNVTKKFKVYFDKPNTLKERLVFWKNNKAWNVNSRRRIKGFW